MRAVGAPYAIEVGARHAIEVGARHAIEVGARHAVPLLGPEMLYRQTQFLVQEDHWSRQGDFIGESYE